MPFRNPFRTLLKLFAEGGIEIRTISPEKSDMYPSHSSPLLARTVIQPDADIITYVSEKIFNHPDIWHKHFKNVASEIDTIRWISIALKWSRPLYLITLLWAVYNLCGAPGVPELPGGNNLHISVGFVSSAIFLSIRFSMPAIRFWLSRVYK